MFAPLYCRLSISTSEESTRPHMETWPVSSPHRYNTKHNRKPTDWNRKYHSNREQSRQASLPCMMQSTMSKGELLSSFCHTLQSSNLAVTQNTRSYRQSRLARYLGIQRRKSAERGAILMENKPNCCQLPHAVRSSEREPLCSGPSHSAAQCLTHHSSPLRMHLWTQNTGEEINIQSFKCFLPSLVR